MCSSFLENRLNLATQSQDADTIASLRLQVATQQREIELLRAELAELIRVDPLTGVMNRRTLEEMLAAELQRSHRTGHPFCFAMLSIDHFKAINERFGTPAGDSVLKTFSGASIKLLRVLDRFGRLEGDRFGIVLPATWLDSGIIAMNRLSAAVAACNWEGITPGMAVTFSAGLTTNAPADTADRMVQRAEQALLQAKSEGRNRTVTIEDALPDMPMLDD
ncbi:MAG: GGDEF domain-containing protein [Herminiimonas sp.]|nr:GGDEF domain-containing protein [Herminiimonas sp.]